MVSFLMNCPQCGATIARDAACPDCQWSETSDEKTAADQDNVFEFALRHKIHTRNYAAFMILSLCTGLIGFLTAVMWVLVIYRGSLLAFLGIALMTVLTGVLSVMLYFCRRWLPVELNCPRCDVRLDELGAIGDQCPSCSAQLKNPHASAAPAATV